ncbi:hypothetical protein HPB52_015363 [Rhipicephalus sanguineus]|uniref:Uncharacterized protein n=1 Tax=Rhipicephalus sanguineus TaxID=34632 RepID=A0A9D4PPE2_RHISA|nr:hypothetical protein HPB52_015363 [Rhipicephalus sanguineus]
MPPTSRGICCRISWGYTVAATVFLQLTAMLCSSAATVGTPSKHSCPEGHFPCSEAKRHCVRREFICDGHRDCPEGSDEKACGDENLKKFIEDYFQKRPDEDREKKSGKCGKSAS